MSRTRTTQSRTQHAKIKPSKNLELRISNPKLEIPLILGGTGQRFRACGDEGAPLVDG